MLATKVDKETVTNALHKKAGKTDLQVLETDIQTKLQSLEDSFKKRFEQLLNAQDHILQIVENENAIHAKTSGRDNPYVDKIHKRIDNLGYECEYKIDQIRQEVSEITNKQNQSFGTLKANTGIDWF